MRGWRSWTPMGMNFHWVQGVAMLCRLPGVSTIGTTSPGKGVSRTSGHRAPLVGLWHVSLSFLGSLSSGHPKMLLLVGLYKSPPNFCIPPNFTVKSWPSSRVVWGDGAFGSSLGRKSGVPRIGLVFLKEEEDSYPTCSLSISPPFGNTARRQRSATREASPH